MAKKSDTEASSVQHDRFIETARALGCDEDPASFDEKLKQIATQTPKAGKTESFTKINPKKISSGQSRK